MKKSFLFKWVYVLGAMLLLANVVLPWINAHAYSDETWMWNYVRNEETWNDSATNWALKVYYANNPSEDLWCGDHKASFNDMEYAAQICIDPECSDTTDVNLTTAWGDTYQTVNDWTNSYLLTMSAEVGSDEIYELYNVIVPTCTIPDGVEGADFPSGWDSPEVCEYRVLFPATDGKCLSDVPEWAPAGAYVPDWAQNLDGSSNADWPDSNGKCLYKAAAIPPSTQPTPSGKYVKLLSSSYPDCTPSYSGALANGAKYPWISIAFNQEFKWVVKFNYSDYQDGVDVYPRGEWIKIWWPVWKAWGEASVPEEFGNEYLVSDGTTTFDLDKFNATLIPARALTIHYVYSNWGEAATDYTWLFLDWEEYNQASPEIVNYTADIAVVTGIITGDVEFTVTYTPSSSLNKSSWWGGGSAKTVKTDDTKVTTTESVVVDEAKVDENNEENKDKDENKVVPMTEAQAVAKFGQEQIDAYKWALENGITTMKTVEDARLDEPLTRSELAKMMVVYIQKVLEKDPVVASDVKYSDVKAEEIWDLVDYIKLAYQYQIMGINADGTPIELFNPHGIVSRWEYATVFSRVLFGAKFNKSGEDFYTNHLEALKTAWILTNTLPSIQEMRGWVMLMMYRSSQNGEAIEKVATAAEENKDEVKAEETTNAESTTGGTVETPTIEEKSETTVENTETTAESTTGDVTEINTWVVAEVATWDAASN